MPTVASTGGSPSGTNITSFTLANVTVQPNQLLVAFVNSVDGSLDFDNEVLKFNGVDMTLNEQVVFNPVQLSKYSYYNNTGSVITGDLVVDWDGVDIVTRSMISYAIIDNAHPTTHHHLDVVTAKASNNNPSLSITPTLDNTLILGNYLTDTDNAYTWDDTVDETVVMESTFNSFLTEFNQGTAAAHANSATTTGLPTTWMMMISVAPETVGSAQLIFLTGEP